MLIIFNILIVMVGTQVILLLHYMLQFIQTLKIIKVIILMLLNICYKIKQIQNFKQFVEIGIIVQVIQYLVV